MKADILFLDLFLQAGIVVQAVMFVLLVMSILSWALIFQRASVLKKANKQAQGFEDEFWSGVDLTSLYKKLVDTHDVDQGIHSVFHQGFREFSRLRQLKADDETVLSSCQRMMRVAYTREMDRLEKNLSILATIGSISPYIGLFGTVWGIMNAFISLGDAQQATLQAVAPGIAEALVATAVGLFAAIPAVMAFNRFTYKVSVLDNRLVSFAEELYVILQRQLAKHNSSKQGEL